MGVRGIFSRSGQIGTQGGANLIFTLIFADFSISREGKTYKLTYILAKLPHFSDPGGGECPLLPKTANAYV